MSTDLARPDELTAHDRAEWNSMLEAQQALSSPFNSVDYALLAGRYWPDARVLCISPKSGERGFLAVDVVSRSATSIAGSLSDRQAMVAPPGFSISLPRSMRRVGLEKLSLDHLVADQPVFSSFITKRRPSPFVDLSSGVDSHLDQLYRRGSKVVSSLRQSARIAEREFGPLHVVHGSSDPHDLAKLIELKSAQYRRSGVRDLFLDHRVRDMATELSSMSGENLNGLMSVLYAGDRPIAHHLGLFDRRIAHWWMPAYDPDASRCSPGLLLLMEFAREMAARGVQELDLGPGGEPYKNRVMSGQRTVATAVVVPMTRGRLLRAGRNRVSMARERLPRR